jgi:hypothetical protein
MASSNILIEMEKVGSRGAMSRKREPKSSRETDTPRSNPNVPARIDRMGIALSFRFNKSKPRPKIKPKRKPYQPITSDLKKKEAQEKPINPKTTSKRISQRNVVFNLFHLLPRWLRPSQ